MQHSEHNIFLNQESGEIFQPFRIEDCASHDLQLPAEFTPSLKMILQALAAQSPGFVNISELNQKNSSFNRTNIFYLKGLMRANPDIFKYLDINMKSGIGYRLIDTRTVVPINTGLRNYRILETDFPEKPFTIADCKKFPELLNRFLKPNYVELLVLLATQAPNPLYISEEMGKSFEYITQTVRELKTQMMIFPRLFSLLKISSKRGVGYILEEIHPSN